VPTPPSRRALVVRAFDLLNRFLARGDPMGLGHDEHDDEHRLIGLFADLAIRPDLLHALLDDVPGGPEVVRRVLHVALDASRDAAQPRSAAEIEALVAEHYAAVRALAAELDEIELVDALLPGTPIAWDDPPSADEWHEEGVEMDVHEFLGDRFIGLEGDDPLHALHEAAYGLAASAELARYVLWPAFERAVTTKDPYRHRADLWIEGVGVRHEGSRIRVWRERPPLGSEPGTDDA
jgi:hypothetical protein